MLGGHGLFTWGDTAEACYETTLRVINQAAEWLAANEKRPAFGGARVEPAEPARRRAVAARLMPAHPRQASPPAERKVGHFTDAPEVLEFVNSQALATLAPLGTSCPDHFLRTKIRPLVLPYDPASDSLEAVIAGARRRDRGLSRRLRRLLRALQARRFAGDARPQRR